MKLSTSGPASSDLCSDPTVTYQQSLFGSEKVTEKTILEAMKKAKSIMREGVGTMTRPLYCHPDNVDVLNAVCKKVGDCKDMSLVKPYRVIADRNIPKTTTIETGKVIWHDTRFIQYSDGPAPGGGLNEKEYLDMCLRWKWAHMEQKEVSVWYEVDLDSFSMALDTSRLLSVRDSIIDKVNDSIAKKVFAEPYSPFSSHPHVTTRIRS